jgi:hypothetical protein
MGKKLSEAAKAMGRKGGKKRAENLTSEQRREIALKGARTRWAKKGDKQ